MCGYVKLALGHGPINNARKKGIRRLCSDLILGITCLRLLCFLDSLQLLYICVLYKREHSMQARVLYALRKAASVTNIASERNEKFYILTTG